MPIVRLLGRVLPSAIKVSFPDVAMSWGLQDLGFALPMRLRILESSVEVGCDLPEFRMEHFSTIYARAVDLARACLDMASFATGYGFFVVFETLVKPDGTEHGIELRDSTLAGICTAFRMPVADDAENQEFAGVLSMIVGEPALLGAMNDLAQILSLHHQSPTNCGRVLDTLRRAVAPNIEPKQGWPILQRIVNADKQYLSYVTNQSTNPRHGDRGHISNADIHEALRRTWTITNRFLEYRKRGNRSLSLIDFPLLLG